MNWRRLWPLAACLLLVGCPPTAVVDPDAPEAILATQIEIISGNDATQWPLAAAAILEQPLPEAAAFIRELLTAPGKERRQLAVIRAIYFRHDVRYVAQMLPLLGSENRELADETARALREALDVPAAWSAMNEFLVGADNNPAARRRTATLLGRLAHRESIPFLIQALGQAGVEAAATGALEELTCQSLPDRGAWEEWHRETVALNEVEYQARLIRRLRQRLRLLLGRQEESLARALELERKLAQATIDHIQALIAGAPENPRVLDAALEAEQLPAVKIHFLEWLGRNAPRPVANDPTLGEEVLGLLADPEATVRAKAARLLGTLARPEALAGLTTRLEDEVPAVRVAAAWALGQLPADREGRVERALLAALRRALPREEAEKDFIIVLIGGFGRQAPIREAATGEQLVALLAPAHLPAINRQAAVVLGDLGLPDAVPALIGLLERPDLAQALTLSAIESIAKILGQNRGLDRGPALAALLPLLEHNETSIVVNTVAALGRIRDNRAVDPLWNLLSHREEGIANQAWAALQAIIVTEPEPAMFEYAQRLAGENRHAQALEIYSESWRQFGEPEPEAHLRERRLLINSAMQAARWDVAMSHLEPLLASPQVIPADRESAIQIYKRIPLYDRALREYGHLVRERHVTWNGEVDETMIAAALNGHLEDGVLTFLQAMQPELPERVSQAVQTLEANPGLNLPASPRYQEFQQLKLP